MTALCFSHVEVRFDISVIKELIDWLTQTSEWNCVVINCRRKPTSKPLPNCPLQDETSVSVVHVTISKSLIECSQVQVDSVVQVKRKFPSRLQCWQYSTFIRIISPIRDCRRPTWKSTVTWRRTRMNIKNLSGKIYIVLEHHNVRRLVSWLRAYRRCS